VPDLGGRSIFLTAFVVPLPPHESFNKNEYAMLRLASMVPYIDDWVAFDGGYDVWCTSTEFLDLCAGDADEHAVLLCCFFLYAIAAQTIKTMKDAWVVIGRADPEGATTWVLSRDQNSSTQARLWDPNKGRVYELTGKAGQCPFKEVVMAFNHREVYVNLQKDLHPTSTSFNFEERDKWLPFYNDKFLREEHSITPVQERKLEYPPISWDDASNIEEEVKQMVRHMVEADWPFDSLPQWHPTKLRPCLQELEEYKTVAGVGGKKPELSPELEKLNRNNVIRGFPINCSYIDTESIVNEVLDTGIHKGVEQSVKFGLEVFVKPYVQGVFSVWVYFISISSVN